MPATTADEWGVRADSAEAAIIVRHLRRLWNIPGTLLGVVAWPAARHERWHLSWNYWWQAHLVDCAVDAAIRRTTPAAKRRVSRIVRGIRIRNLTGWTNNYYDDMAWLGIALERGQRLLLIENRTAIGALEAELYDAWDPKRGGGIPWRKRDNFFNAPANGPAGIMLARTGRVWRAQQIADWLDETLRDPDTGLIFDGIRDGELDRPFYTYCQGVVLGLETELAVRLQADRHNERVHRLVAAVAERMTDDDVIAGGGGGDGGLFNAILARYLAFVATELPGDTDADDGARETAARIVLASAQAAWRNRLEIEGRPLFGHDWTKPADVPAHGAGIAKFSGGSVHSSDVPERDLSVQVGGWMVLEAACVVASKGRVS